MREVVASAFPATVQGQKAPSELEEASSNDVHAGEKPSSKITS